MAAGERRRGDLADERGAAAVELALVLPILVMLLVGIIEFGRGYQAKLELTAAAREGARAAALGGNGATVAAAVKTASGALDPTKLVIPAVAPCTAGQSVTVVAQYPYEISIPFFGERTSTLESRSVMRCGG